MKGYKDTTKTQYSKGGSVSGPKGAAKVSNVMREFKAGELHSGSKGGPTVKNRKQAIAIALSEARKRPMKKSMGGDVEVPDRMYRGETERAGEAKLREQLRRQADRRKGVPVAPKEPLIDANRRAAKERSSRPLR